MSAVRKTLQAIPGGRLEVRVDGVLATTADTFRAAYGAWREGCGRQLEVRDGQKVVLTASRLRQVLTECRSEYLELTENASETLWLAERSGR